MKKTTSAVAILLMSVAFTGAYGDQSTTGDMEKNAPASVEIQKEFKSLQDQYSYAYGVDLGSRFKGENIDINVTLLAEGMKDVVGGDMKLSKEMVVATMKAYHEMHFKKKAEARAAKGVINKKVGAEFLARNSKEEGIKVTQSGLQYRVITPGEGGYTPNAEDIVNVHYRATYVDGTQFDSTYDRNEVFSTKVRMLIPGWAEAVQKMTPGAKWQLFIPAELGYGEEGAGEYVEPQSALIFEVELISIEKAEDSIPAS